MTTDDAVIELRQYTLHPDQRDVLIDVFDREFVEGQEAVGMTIIGQFRDLNDPDRFVWLRGFSDMPARAESLNAFYTGPVWRANRDTANATMIDSDNVLLLRPAGPGAGFDLDLAVRDTPASSIVVATLYHLPSPVGEEFIRFFDQDVAPLVEKAGATPLARLCTEYAENNFPGLPVREGEHVFAWFASFPSERDYHAHREGLAELTEHADLPAKVEWLVLSPTDRSALR